MRAASIPTSFLVRCGVIAVAAALGASSAFAQSAPKADAGTAAAKSDSGAAASKASAPRQSIRWSGETPNASRTVDAAYLEIEAATSARDEADRRLKEAVVPLQGETIRQPDGSVRYLPSYYDRIAPFERAAMIANDRLDRANDSLRTARPK